MPKSVQPRLQPNTGADRATRRVLWFEEISIGDVPLVGGKNASLGEMYSHLAKKGVPVPNGFAVTATAYWEFLRATGIDEKIKLLVKDLDIVDLRQLARVGSAIRTMILTAPLPDAFQRDVVVAYKKLAETCGKKNVSVAVRSSATAEDLPDASFAGQQETYLNVRGQQSLLLAVRKCIASLFTNRALSYRESRGYDHVAVALSVAVQEMVSSDTGASGVMFTLDTESGFRGVTLVTSSYGLGEYVVKGRVTPDQFYVFKNGLTRGKDAIISRILGTKNVKLVYGKTAGTKQASVYKSDQNRFAISDADVLQLARWGQIIEDHYQKPQDIEWAKDGKTGKLYIVQARPETVKARADYSFYERYELKKISPTLLTGIAVGQKIGAGKVRVIDSPRDMKQFKKGEILVTRITDPDWEPIMRIASAIVTEQGGKTSHAAIVSRELGVPCIVGATSARKVLRTGQQVTVSCAKGDEGIIYRGILPFEVKRTIIDDTISTKTKIMMNVGDPDHAFRLSFLPHDGIGLARLEFIFSNFIRIHPLALVNYNTLKDKRAKKKIKEMTRGYTKKTDYCVDKLAEGVARIAAASYPHDVVVRLSDFKTNEYATLIGGKEFEPKEENPMLGWRGASRYYSKQYKKGFQLECEAMKKVRDEWGLENVILMIPFCRTPEEGERVLATMKSFGLERGKNGLKVYVMCEIPSNVILAEEFAKLFDGFSIGSNDLTQLTLGVDRDSSVVSHIYDENNLAVKTLIRDVIRVAHTAGKKVGICGQAPSDYPEFAEFLVREGIDSISLNPDTVVETKKRIAEVENTLGKTGRNANKPLLSLVAVLALIGASLIGLGAGCASKTSPFTPGTENAYVSPAKIREHAEERIRAQTDAEKDATMTPFVADDFADFSIAYPLGWGVKQWRGGVTFHTPDGQSYMTVARQLVAPPIVSAEKEPIEIDGVHGFVYTTTLEDGTSVRIVEMIYKGMTIEISGTVDRFDDILHTLDFVSSSSPGITEDRPLTQWDVKEKRLCAQVITFARVGAGACVAFPTPCDVPDGWRVCEAQ